MAKDGLHSGLTIESLEKQIAETKWLLHPSAGRSFCSIFRAPECLVEINMKTYRPHIVSIGPYHHGEHHLEMMQQHKWRFLYDLLTRTQSTGPKIDDYLLAVASLEEDIRQSYSQTLNICTTDLVEMMVLDGLFIIELFRKVEGLSPVDPGDPVVRFAWILCDLIRDLLRLENQIPFIVLKKLFDMSNSYQFEGTESYGSLDKLALHFFSLALRRPAEVLEQRTDVKAASHLLDLIRLSFIRHNQNTEYSHPFARVLTELAEMQSSKINSSTRKEVKRFLPGFKSKTRRGYISAGHLIQSATKLHLAGIKFKLREAMSFMDIKFSKGVLEIPMTVLDDLFPDLLLNFVAFEQCSTHSSKHVTSYAAFMSCLIRTPADATFLCDNCIIENYIGTDKDVANFFRNLGKNLPLDLY